MVKGIKQMFFWNGSKKNKNEDSPENIKNLYHCIRKINGHKVYDLKGPVPSKEEKIEIDEDGL